MKVLKFLGIQPSHESYFEDLRLGRIPRNFKIFIFEGNSQKFELGWISGISRIQPIYKF